MTPAGWEEEEPGFAFARAEVRRLVRRSRPRLAWILLFGVLAAGGFAVKRALKPPKREASMSLRIVEADLDLTREVRPVKDYVNYIWGVFLSGPNLEKIIKRHDLYPEKARDDVRKAVEAMRDELEVDVWRNYFLNEQWQVGEEARSVRFSITWRHTDPKTAIDVVHALADTIIAAQTEERRATFVLGQQTFDDAEDMAVASLTALHIAEAERRAGLRGASPAKTARLLVELRDLEKEEVEQQKRVETMTDERSRFDITAKWENARSGLRFEMVDPGYVVPLPSGTRTLVITIVGIFFGACFCTAMVFGAFEVKIRQADDIHRLGVPLLGSVPTFRGDAAGSMTDRLKSEDRLRWAHR